MDLETFWFCLIAVLWAGYFVLEGFDFGVGMLLPFVPRDDAERETQLRAIGPVWDGNETWLVVAGGATFAAFPAWYATMFSGLYLALLLVLFFLIIRVVSFEWREKSETPGWRRVWTSANTIGSVGAALIWGVGLASLVHGLPIDSDGEYAGSFWDLFTPYTVFAGIAVVLLFAFHGATFLTLRVAGDLGGRAESAARNLAVPAALVAAAFLIWTVAVAIDRNDKNLFPPALPAALGIVALALAVAFLFAGRSGRAFAMTAAATVALVATLFTSLYPRVMVSSPDFENSLTVDGAASSHYALSVMSVVALIFVPLVLLYQGWTYYVFRKRVSKPPERAPVGFALAPAGGARHRVVIVGGGFGGLFAAKFLRRAPVDVTLIDRTNHHLFQPLLYQLATAILSEGDVAPPLRQTLRRHKNVEVQLANVTGFDLERKVVTAQRPLGHPIEYAYDSLIVATGATGSYFGHDEYSTFAPGLKTIDDALELRARIFGAFEMAESARDPDEQRAWLTFAVIGGGPTGVEMAGQITELAHRSLGDNFRRIDPKSARVLLFDAGDAVLGTFGTKLSEKAERSLTRIGVEVHTGARVTGITYRDITVEGSDGPETIPCHVKVWAAGVTASPLASMLADASGAETDRAGRVEVLPDCSLHGHPEVFAIGDMMALDNLPGVAEVAMQSGIHAAWTIKHRVQKGSESKPFKYRDLGSMASIARFSAVVDFKGIRVSGFIGWMMWVFVHLTFLTGFKNRFITLSKWIWAFIGNSRDERTSSLQQAYARVIAADAGIRPGEEDLTRLLAGDGPSNATEREEHQSV